MKAHPDIKSRLEPSIPTEGMRTAVRLSLLAAAFMMLGVGVDAWGQERDDAKPVPFDQGKGLDQKPRERRKAGDKAQVSPVNPRIQLGRADGYILERRFDEAIVLLERLVAEFPQMGEASDRLATCYLKVGRPRDAAMLLENVLVKSPDRYSSIRDLGTAYLDMGDKEKAVAAWRRLLKNDARSGAYYGVVAKLEQDAGLYDEALATLREGLAIKEHRDGYARQIVQLERLMGHEEDAFREALLLAGERENAGGLDLRGPAIEIFSESKAPERLLAIADSFMTARGGGNEQIRFLKVVFLVNGGRYREASEALFDKDAPRLREEDFYSLLMTWENTAHAHRDEQFAAFCDGAMQGFLRDYGNSFLAPGVMLMMAAHKREAAGRGGTAAESLFGEAIALADQATQHRQGAPYREQAALLKARVLFEDLHRPTEALAQLDKTLWRSDRFVHGAAELRVRALLASGDWAVAEKGLERLSGTSDSTIAVLGRYGLGRLRFLKGQYAEAVSALSRLAERYPWSPSANDALEMAIAIKESMQTDVAALELYRSATLASERGEYSRALDTLAALEDRFPLAKLAPRAHFMKADLEAALGNADQARDDFTRLAEEFPLHELAPRALERVADMAEGQSADEAMKEYGVIIERYPDYAFLERVRGKYVALEKTAAGAGETGDEKRGKK